jgi:3-methyl-2-oxobutanoate hydroxymethyltransferase
MTQRLSVRQKLDILRAKKGAGVPLSCLTAYDYPTARLVDEAGADLILVGDSLGMVVLGYEDTTSVTMDEMIHHTKAAARGISRALILGDLPYHSYETPEDAVANARRLVAAGAEAIKLEGGRAVLPQVEAIIGAGIPFIGHIGMLPQHVKEEGGYKKKGKTPEGASRLLEDARVLDYAGAEGMVLESMVPEVATKITEEIDGYTIGIGAGKKTGGQILVLNDLIGSFPWFVPSFATQRANVAGETSRAVREYVAAVQRREL